MSGIQRTGGSSRRIARRLTPLRLPASALALAMGLTACSLPVTSAHDDTHQETASETAAALPEGISIGVYQAREDYALRRLEVTVTNTTDTDFVVNDLSFGSPQFVAPAVYPKPTSTIRAGSSVDLKVMLAEASCDSPGDDAATVTVGFDWGQTSGTATVTPEDILGQLKDLTAEDCLLASVDQVVSITAADHIDITEVDGVTVANLDLLVEPSEKGGEVTVNSLLSTVLLSLLPNDGVEPVEQIALEKTFPGKTLATDADFGLDRITLRLVPTRCDPHVVQEDKRGTFFPLDVTTATGSGRIFVPVSDQVRGELYEFVALACEW